MEELQGTPFEINPSILQVYRGVRWWERMRLFYNLAITATACLVVTVNYGLTPLSSEALWIAGGFYLFAANIFYFLGPVTDTYIHVFVQSKTDFHPMRWVLFCIGTMVSLLLTSWLALFADPTGSF